MKNVYIGKKSVTGKGLAICKVIDSDIATGNALVYNRETDHFEIITLSEKHTLYSNIKKLAEDTESEFVENEKEALKRIKIEELEKELTKVCCNYENDCSKCPKQNECAEYCKLAQIYESVNR